MMNRRNLLAATASSAAIAATPIQAQGPAGPQPVPGAGN